MKNKALLYGIVVFQAAVIGMIALSKGYTRVTGRKIMARAVPVDPRSLFRGDYVILKYDFSVIDLKEQGLEKAPVRRGDYLFLTLKRGEDGFWKLGRASPVFPEDGGDEETVVLRGLVTGDPRRSKRADLVFGVESFFVPEGEGKYIEKYRQKRELSAEISVDKSGRAAVSRLFIAGREVGFP